MLSQPIQAEGDINVKKGATCHGWIKNVKCQLETCY